MKPDSYEPSLSFIDLLLDAVCVVDSAGHFKYVSAACERIFGYTPDEMVGRPLIDLVVPEDRARTLQAAAAIMSGHAQHHFENSYVRKDGQIVHIRWSASWSEADQLRIAVAHDITERKQAESLQTALYAISEAAHAAEDLGTLFQQIHRIIGQLLPAHNFSVALCDEKDDQLSFPYHVDEYDQASALLKPAATLCEEVVRTGESLLLTPEIRSALPEHLRALVGTQRACWLGVPLNSHQGTIGALALRSHSGDTHYTEKDQALLQFVSAQIATAVERKQLHEQLKYTARYDELTNLPNRRLLFDRLDTALARTRRNQGRMALLYADLDQFKAVNDTFGHAAGDALLRGVAERLARCVRDVDTVARIGGDEFVVLLENIQVSSHAAVVADRIRAALHQPLIFNERKLCITPSIGIALYPEHGDEAQQLLRHADEAMYAAKKAATGVGRRASDRAVPVMTPAAGSRYRRRESDRP